MQAVLFSNIEDEKFLMEIVKAFSSMPYYAPTKYISTLKQFRLHVAARYPDWNLTFYDNRAYHATFDHHVHRSMDEMKQG